MKVGNINVKEFRISELSNPKSKRAVIISVDDGLVIGNVRNVFDRVEVLKELIEWKIDDTLIGPEIVRITPVPLRGVPSIISQTMHVGFKKS